MKKTIVKSFKMIAAGSLTIVTVFLLVGGYQYLKVALAPEYHAETMSLNYEVLGSGESPLLLIHGLAGSKNYWKQDLEEIKGTYKLLLVDLLGFGDSPKPQSDYTLKTQLEALEKIIVKEGFNKGRTVIVGHSLGAILSLALFAKHPDWFAGTAVIGLPVFESRDQFTEQMSNDLLFDRIAIGPYGKLFCMLHPLYLSKWLKPENLTDEVFSDSKKHTWQSYYYSLNEVILKTDLYDITKNIRDRKVLFIQGTKDKIAPITNVKNFASTFTNAQFIEVKDGDHQLFLKEPFEVWGLISNFYKNNIKT